MTKKEWYEELINMVGEMNIDEDKRKDATKFLEHELELLNKKSSKTTPTKKQRENVELKQSIVNVLATYDEPVAFADFKTNDALPPMSDQKLSALLRQLTSEMKVIRTEEKRHPFYSIGQYGKATN